MSIELIMYIIYNVNKHIKFKYNQNQNLPQKQDNGVQPIYSNWNSNNQPQNEQKQSHANDNEDKKEPVRQRFMSMADYHKQQQSMDDQSLNKAMSSLNINMNYYIGDQIFYPKNHGELEEKLRQNNYDINKVNHPTRQQDPSKYSLGQVLSINVDKYTLTIADALQNNNNQNITIHASLISKFPYWEYNDFIRGISVSFYDELSSNWNTGRIESVIDKSVGINYGHDNFTMVPIWYLKKYEEIKEDEWSEASDFVFREYVRDVATELAKKSLSGNKDVIDPDEFRAAMERLGIRSSTSRNKAFQMFGEIKEDIITQQRAAQNNMSATFKLLMSEGHVIGPYKCCGYCQQNKNNDGVCLSNCKHTICKQCFAQLTDNAIQSKSSLKCPQCMAVMLKL